MRVGVIGLGHIGGAVAANLLEDGHDLTVHDRDESRYEPLVREGADAAAGAPEVARRTEITFLSLPTPADVREVAGLWLEGAAEGSVLVDLSTNAPAAVREVGEQVASRGAHLIESPLTGGAPGAKHRMLVFFAAGEPGAFERCRPILEKLGRAVFYFGELGRGNTAKLVNSLLAFSATWVSLEGLAIATRAGIDLRTMVDAVRTGGASNFYMDRMVEGIDQRGRPPQFTLRLAAKDAGLIVEAAHENGVPAPVAEQIAKVFDAAVDAGLGERDWSDLVEWIEYQAAVELRLGRDVR